MEISQFALARLLLYAFLTGGFLAVVYDILRVFRAFFDPSTSCRIHDWRLTVALPHLKTPLPLQKHKCFGILLFAEDLIFCLFGAVLLILLFYEWNEGKIRIPAILCAIVGFFCYRILPGKLLTRLFEVVAFGIWVLFRYLFFFLALPQRLLWRGIRALTAMLWQRYKQKRDRAARKRMTKSEWERLALNAAGLLPITSQKEVDGGSTKKEAI